MTILSLALTFIAAAVLASLGVVLLVGSQAVAAWLDDLWQGRS